MKTPYHLAALPLAAALLSACSPFTRIEGDSRTLAKLDGSWAVRSVAGKEIPPPHPVLRFDSAAGTLSGSDGCNRISGRFSFEDGRLKARAASTRMACLNETAASTSAAIHTLLGQGAEVVEVAVGAGRALLIRNAEAEIRLVPAEHDQ
ncbi:MAG: META domain-containing protein [Zoogloea sp.]|uniref:META domain-containing protein n=1 Tax=Zoogloea sp. TaxID=49181 RepID=UPI0026094680|nr:META domain-containing protein [Zoogloea sp.]MDD3326121.1 META domain-containing protein [Zoogloea sp.]